MKNPATSNNNRIIKNTLLLYFRMIVVTLLSLITVRYTLQILGIEDYGIYNVVGGAVTFLTFITATMSSATQRFLAYELGRNDNESYNNMFNALIGMFLIIGVILLCLFEVFAYPLVYQWLQLPPERLSIAFIVYQFSAFCFIINVLAIPFISSILASENMGVYAYITIADTLSKLLLLAILIFAPFDKLASYAIGIFVITIFTNLIYIYYNQRYIASTKIYLYWNRHVLKELSVYTGWSFFGSISAVMCNQGLTILMNLFFGVAVNAAKAISDRIMTIVQSFVTNFYMAVSPQITKNYASGYLGETIALAFNSTRLGYYLMLLLSVPAILLTDKILYLWLGASCTEDMVVFTQLSLVFALVNVFETPITFMMRATGNLKKYQVVIGMITLLVVPISYFMFYIGFPAFVAFLVETAVYVITQIFRVYIAKQYYSFTIQQYLKGVVASPLVITATIIVSVLILSWIGMGIYLTTLITFALSTFLIWQWGLTNTERTYALNKIKNIIKKK